MNPKCRRRRSIRAMSPVIGEVLMIALTLSVGFATWAWIGGSASHSEANLNGTVVRNLNQLNENYAIVYANFSRSADHSVTLWFYNYGNNGVNVKQIFVDNGTLTNPPITVLSSTIVLDCGYCLNISARGTVRVTLNVSSFIFLSGVSYQFKAVGMYGSTTTYEETR